MAPGADRGTQYHVCALRKTARCATIAAAPPTAHPQIATTRSQPPPLTGQLTMRSPLLPALLLPLALAGTDPLQQRQRPSLLLLMADDMGAGDPAYAGSRAKTPHLDAWSRSNGTIKLKRQVRAHNAIASQRIDLSGNLLKPINASPAPKHSRAASAQRATERTPGDGERPDKGVAAGFPRSEPRTVLGWRPQTRPRSAKAAVTALCLPAISACGSKLLWINQAP